MNLLGKAYRFLTYNLSQLHIRYFAPDEDFVYDFKDFKMKLASPRRSLVGRSIYLEGVWEEEVTRFVKIILNPRMVVFDVGAHIGYYSLLCASVSRKVICFEVDKDTITWLNSNIERSRFDNILVIEKALFSKSANVVFEGWQLGSGFSNNVECVKLDDIAGREGVPEHADLIKIDVEGAELDVLKGGRSFFRSCHPKLIIEVHSLLLPNFGYSIDDVLSELSELGYFCSPIDYETIDFSQRENITVFCE